jgi:hypothetical protein
MHRLAASLLGVKVIHLTEDQFESVKKWGVLGLSVAFATISTAVSLVAHQPERSPQPSRLARSLRAYIARRRKAVIRKVEVPSGVRVVHHYVPVADVKEPTIRGVYHS